jgi:hypothetical protein
MRSPASISIPSIMASNSALGRSKRPIGSTSACVVGQLARPANSASTSCRQAASSASLAAGGREPSAMSSTSRQKA